MTIRILLTGASGTVGLYICQYLSVHSDIEVFAVSTKPHSIHDSDNITWYQKDLRDKYSWNIFEANSITHMIHTAALIPGVNDGMSDSVCVKTNITIDNNAIAFAERIRAKLIFFSSASVYGHHISGNIMEDHKTDPDTEYARSKLKMERHALSTLTPDSTTILRPTSIYSTNQRSKSVLTNFIDKALTNTPIQYFGTGDRKQDFVHASDVALAAIAAITRNNGIFNIGSGSSISMLSLAKTICSLAKSHSSITASDSSDPQENFRPLYSITRASNSLSWHPSISLHNGLSKMIAERREKLLCL